MASFKTTIFLALLICFSTARADLLLGSGFSNVTGGRKSPMLYGAIDTSTFALVANSVGVKNTIYSHSAYQLGIYSQFEPGKYLWGNLRAGIGIVAHYAVRKYREEEGAEMLSASDFSAGPGIRVRWNIMPKAYIGVESMYGISGYNTLVLSFKHITNLVFGVRF